jgi:uncharacterized protein with NAD-binding domain and iron-sulfur cluster
VSPARKSSTSRRRRAPRTSPRQAGRARRTPDNQSAGAATAAAGPTPPVKVAIVGGGCAGITAAWELSSQTHESGARKFDITVYEKSWRLGGKGASGRDDRGRIREHGIHIWLGFYENAFEMMRQCYRIVHEQGWGPEKSGDEVLPYGSFDDAFFPEPHIGVAAKYRDIQEAWTGHLPPMEGQPGTPLTGDTNPFTLQAYLIRCVQVSKALIHSVLAPPDEQSRARPGTSGRSTLDDTLDHTFSFSPTESPSLLIDRLTAMLRAGTLTGAAGLLQGVAIIESFLRNRNPLPSLFDSVLKVVEAVVAQVRRQLRDVVNIDPETRRKTEVIDLIITIVVGLFRDNVLFDARGLDAINHIDCKEWLRRHGALEQSIQSPFVTGLYDLAFCYQDGDRKQPALAAGQALRGALRMFFSYRGSIFWRMRGGMGETVFSPLYRVLKLRNVTFKFLHELTDATFEKDEKDAREHRLTSLTFRVQNGPKPFAESPLDHFGCWRHTPPAASATSEITLRDGQEFDVVVLAMAIADFSRVCRARLSNVDKRWVDMCDHVGASTTATQAAQVWMTRDLEELGWRRGTVLLSAMDGPFETWADMTHTLATERAWRRHPEAPKDLPRHDAVKSIAYFCGVLPRTEIDRHGGISPKDLRKSTRGLSEHALEDLRRLLQNRMHAFWPHAKEPLTLLADASGKPGGKLEDQHVQVSFAGSDRYTLALPGSLEYRISPLERSVVNMTIAGDWTECGFNEGCIEAAVMSGRLAAHAICRQPDLDAIIGFNHP